MSELPIYVCGQPVAGVNPVVVRAPFDNELLGSVTQAGPEHAEQAVAGCVRAAKILRGWSSAARAGACTALWWQLSEKKDDFAKTIAAEAGKPLKAAEGEVQRALMTLKLSAEEATRISGEQLPVDISPTTAGYHAVVERFPVGPCLFITPFNFPLNLMLHKIGPAIAAGCPFIVKPSDRTPLTALKFAELLTRTDLPPEAWSVLPCDRTIAAALVADERIKLLSFTGSPQVGWALKAAAGKKKVVLELGNASAVIVEPMGDLDTIAQRIVNGAFGYAGQSCISVQRVFMHESIADELTQLLVTKTLALRTGDPLRQNPDVGPVIDAASADRIMQWISESGGEVLCGNRREGNIIAPTIVRNARADAKLHTEEVFGPVMALETYRTLDDALERINNTRWGLQAGIFCKDIFKIRQAFTTLDVGGFVVNDVPTTRIDNMPYGGVKDSGLGREGVKYAIQEMTEPRVLLTRYA